MSREDWPEMSYTAAMMEDLRLNMGPSRKVIGYRDKENVSEEQRDKTKATVRLNARQRTLLPHLKSNRELPAPCYAGGYTGEKSAIARLCNLGVWRETWSEAIYEDDAPETTPNK